MNYVLPVQKALQGYPESSRLWATHVDQILNTKFALKLTAHEGCLYYGTYINKEIIYLRQVDDFALVAKNEITATALINEIDSHMTIDIKDLGLLTRHNGVDICPSKFIKQKSRKACISYPKIHATIYQVYHFQQRTNKHTLWTLNLNAPIHT